MLRIPWILESAPEHRGRHYSLSPLWWRWRRSQWKLNLLLKSNQRESGRLFARIWWTILCDGEARNGQKRFPRGSKGIETGDIWHNQVASGCRVIGLSRSALVMPARLAPLSSTSLAAKFVSIPLLGPSEVGQLQSGLSSLSLPPWLTLQEWKLSTAFGITEIRKLYCPWQVTATYILKWMSEFS